MDKKQLLNALLIGALLFILMQWFFNSRNAPPPAATEQAASLPAGVTAIHPPQTQPGQALDDADKPQIIELGSIDPNNPAKLHVIISNVGAAIDRVEMNPRDYRTKVGSPDPFVLLSVDPAGPRPFTTDSVRIDDNLLLTKDWVWHVESKTPTEVRLTIRLGENLGKLTKVFRIDPSTYTVTISHEIENTTEKPMKVTVNQLGPTDLNWDSVQSDPRLFQAAVLSPGTTNEVKAAYKTVWHSSMTKTEKEPLGDFKTPPHLVWVAASDRFFTVIVRPVVGAGLPSPAPEMTPNGAVITPDFPGDATVEKLGQRTVDGNDWRVLGIRLAGNMVSVPAGGKTELPLSVFMGPKKRDLLEGSLTAAPGTPERERFIYRYLEAVQVSQGGPCSYCTSAELAWFILHLLTWIHTVTFGNYGVAIIVLVIVVRLLLHPLTRYSQISMAKTQRKMAKIQPKLEAIKKKYKDKQQQSAETMKVWKEEGVNPAGGVLGCLPMMLQMPIWLALYAGLAIDIDLRHATFIPGWITDLTSSDTVALFKTSFHVPIFGIYLNGANYLAINILPLLLGVIFFVQMKVQMRTMPKPADDQQAQTQKYSQYMMLLFPVFLYNQSSGLNLYIFASTLGGLFDTWVVRRHLRKEGLIDPPKGKEE